LPFNQTGPFSSSAGLTRLTAKTYDECLRHQCSRRLRASALSTA
jgi:hypothetical protein